MNKIQLLVIGLLGLFCFSQNIYAEDIVPIIESKSDQMVFSYTGKASLEGQVYILNNSTKPLKIIKIVPSSLQDAVQIDQKTCNQPLDPGKECNFSYRYTSSKTPIPDKEVHGENLLLNINAIDADSKKYSLSYPIQVFHVNNGHFLMLPQNTPSYHEVGNSHVENVFVAPNGTVYAANDSGLSISHDFGANFSTYTSAQGLADNFVTGVATEENDIYVATIEGLSISHDGGANWNVVNASTPHFGGRHVYGVYKVPSEKIICAAIWPSSSLANDGGVSISRDGGNSWETFTHEQGVTSNFVSNVYALMVNHKLYLYVATGFGLSVSRDEGKTWQTYDSSTIGFGNNSVNDVFVTNDGGKITIYAATQSGLSISRDDGKTWVTHTFGRAIVNKVHASEDGKNIYAATASATPEENQGGLFISSDAGISWVVYDEKTPGFGSRQVYGVYVLHEKDKNNIYAATAKGLSISMDNGNTWKTYSTYANNNLVGLKISGDGSYLYSASFMDGLFVSTDGGANWKNYTIPVLGDRFLSSVDVDGNNIYVTTYRGGLSFSTNGGISWTTYGEDKGLASNETYDVYANGNTLYVGTKKGLSVSTDGGTSWTTYLSGLTVGAVYVGQEGRTICAAINGKGLKISQDSGRNWTTYDESTPGFGSNNIAKIYVSSDGQKIYAATVKGLSVSLDAGKNWKTYTTEQKLASNIITSVYASSDGKNIYVGTFDGGISISHDGGNAWKTYSTAQGVDFQVVEVRPTSDGAYVYAATYEGVFYSSI